MQKDLNELKLACQKGSDPTDDALLEMGETVSLFGKPAPAEKGTIALRTGDYTLIVKETDVLETTKYEDNYLVKLRKGTDVIFRLEVVSQIGSAECDCNGKKGNSETIGSGPIALQPQTGFNDAFGGWDKWGGLWHPPYHCWYVIHWEKRCWSYRDKNGILHVYCYQYPVIEKQCDNWF